MRKENHDLEYSGQNSGNGRPQSDDQEDPGKDKHSRNYRGEAERIVHERRDLMANES